MKPCIDDIEDARVLVHGQAIDLIFGASMWTLFRQPLLTGLGPDFEKLAAPAARLYLSHILLTLCKVGETYRKFKYLLPAKAKAHLKCITAEIQRREIPDFRNKVIGHILDDDTKRPISPEDVDRRIYAMIEDKITFLTWILNLNDARDTSTVVGKLRECERELANEKQRIELATDSHRTQ